MKKILLFILCFIFNCAMAQDFIIQNKNAPSSPAYLLDKRNVVIKTKKIDEPIIKKNIELYEKQAENKEALSPILGSNKVNWGPYMQKVSLDIRSNWIKLYKLLPNKTCNNKTAVGFKINKDGNAFDYKVITTSGSIIQDEAAINSIKQASPFEKLPLEFDKDDVEIEFNFECYSSYANSYEKKAKPKLKKNEHFYQN